MKEPRTFNLEPDPAQEAKARVFAEMGIRLPPQPVKIYPRPKATPEQLAAMPTIDEMDAYSEDEKLAMQKAAKGGNWEPGYRPYCGSCDTFHRMDTQTFGFRCRMCENLIGHDYRRLRESPLNT